jgi:hypothetical protein
MQAQWQGNPKPMPNSSMPDLRGRKVIRDIAGLLFYESRPDDDAEVANKIAAFGARRINEVENAEHEELSQLPQSERSKLANEIAAFGVSVQR